MGHGPRLVVHLGPNLAALWADTGLIYWANFMEGERLNWKLDLVV